MKIALWAALFLCLEGGRGEAVGVPRNPVSGGTSGAQAGSDVSVSFRDLKKAVRVPFDLYYNLVVVSVRVNGKGPFPFGVDTGASGSFVEESLLDAMGVQTAGTTDASGAGSSSYQVKKIPHLIFSFDGGLEVSTAHAIALSWMGMAHGGGRMLYGAIGHDVLKNFVVQIDYQRKRMTLYAPDAFHYSDRGTAFPMTFQSDFDPQIDGLVNVPGKPAIPARLTLDTGGGGTVLSTPFVTENHILESVGKTLASPTHGVGNGESKDILGRITSLSIGPYVLHNPLVELSHDTVGSFANPTLGINLGGDILSRFTVIVDYARQKLILEPNSHLSDPFLSDASGILSGS